MIMIKIDGIKEMISSESNFKKTMAVTPGKTLSIWKYFYKE